MTGAAKRTRILFLCTGNSCRSQMAEGWARHLLGSQFEVASAGTLPQGLNTLAVRAMDEIGIDISSQTSKHVDEFAGQSFDLAVTVCDAAQQACPNFPGAARVVHQAFDDPPKLARNATSEEEALSHYRRIRDEIGGFAASIPSIIAASAGAQR